MDLIVQHMEETKLDITELRKYLPSYAKAVLYKTLSSSKKEAFGNHRCIVVLYESTIGGKKQGHYVVLVRSGDSVSYFSSLGRSPRDELQALKLDESAKFAKILGKSYSYNKTPLQNSRNYKINTCGLFAIARCLLADQSNREFVRFYKRRSVADSDQLVGITTLLLKKFVET